MGYDDARYASWVAGSTPDRILARQQARPGIPDSAYDIYDPARRVAMTQIGRGGSALDQKLRTLMWRGRFGQSSGAGAQIAGAQVANRANILDRLLGVEMAQKQADLSREQNRQSEYDYQTGAMQGELQTRLGIGSMDAQSRAIEQEATAERHAGQKKLMIAGAGLGLLGLGALGAFGAAAGAGVGAGAGAGSAVGATGAVGIGTAGSAAAATPWWQYAGLGLMGAGYVKGTKGYVKPPRRAIVGEDGPEMMEHRDGKMKITPTSMLMKKPEIMRGMTMAKPSGGRSKQRAQRWAGAVRGGGSGRYGMGQGRHGHDGGMKSAIR